MDKSIRAAGVCPLKSEEILRFTLNGLRERDVLKPLAAEQYLEEAKMFGALLPDNYLPDIYLDLPLTGGAYEGMAAVFDCYDRCRLDYTSDGRYFRELEVPSKTEPKDRDTLCVLYPDGTFKVMEPGSFFPASEADFPAGVVSRRSREQPPACRGRVISDPAAHPPSWVGLGGLAGPG